MSEETVTLRYTVEFEKRIKAKQCRHESRQNFIDRIADNLFKHENDYTDATVLGIANVEEKC
ncbi:hypothetical protein [Staphylococcus sp. 231237_7MaSpsaltlick]|uniref:hypothetical protein n=1 Tax=Staphylococcus TaxID=1279 RepID=UPI00370B3988